MRQEKKDEIFAIILLTLGVFILLSLITFHPADISFYSYPPNAPVKNMGGFVGAYIGGFLFFLMGLSAYFIPVLFLLWGLNRFFKTAAQRLYSRVAGAAILLLSSSSLISIIVDGGSVSEFKSGGTFGYFLSKLLLRYCGVTGTYLILSSLVVLSLVLATEFMIFPVLQKIGRFLVDFLKRAKSKVSLPSLKIGGRKAPAAKPKAKDIVSVLKRKALTVKPGKPPIAQKAKAVEISISKPLKTKTAKPAKAPAPAKEAAQPAPQKTKPLGEYKLPSLDLLDSPPPIEERKIKDDLKTNSGILESTLADFDVEAKVVRVEQGPVITRYELEPPPGVKVNKITALNDNIALAMKAQSVRIVAPMPGRGTVGVEVPNTSSSMVYLKEVMDSDEFKKSGSKLSLALGKDIAGKAVIADLADMPHLLIAGTTGSGKTVCVNCIITGLLFSMGPEEVKLLMIDPKMVELAPFNGLPHLLCPVVTDAKKAAVSLNWVVNEMEKRYKLLSKVTARNINAFNEKIKKAKEEWLDDEGSPIEKMPYIIVIIDELADLMVVAKDSIESAITRLAQLSRAVGIHIILATQRPSVDVITGVIKANFPARVSFQVASKVDSRTVLDMNGADKLLGKGDMLFIDAGENKPVRAQGSLISDAEINRIVEFIKSQRGAVYDESMMTSQEKKAAGKTFERDEIFEEAVKVVLQTKQASVSMLQRRLGLGYTRAARLIDAMEDDGIVGPYRGSKPREILVSSEETSEETKE